MKRISVTLIKNYLIKLIVISFINFLSTSCGEESTSTSPAPTDPNTVFIQNFSFNPDSRTAPPGTTIIWINNDNVSHTVTSGNPENQTGLFDSGTILPGGSFSFKFSQTGTFNYFCSIHPNMIARVIIQ